MDRTDALPDPRRRLAMDEAVGLLLGGRYEAAARTLRDLLDTEPDDVVALANLGMTLQMQGRHAEAEAAYRHAVELNPEHTEAHFNLGTTLLAQERRDEAGDAFHRAMVTGTVKPHLRAAAVQGRLVAGARQHPAAALALAPGEDPLAAGMRRGLALRAQGLQPAATRCFHEVLAIDPTHGPAALCAGEICVWTGRLAEARHDLSIALRWAAAAWPPAHTAFPEKRLDKGSARVALFAVQEALANAGIDAFLNGGTALGCVREQDFIRFDSDVDVGVLPGADPANIIDAIEAHPLLEYRYHDVHAGAVLRVRFGVPDGVGGDVFLYQEDADGLWCGVERGPYALRWRDTRFGLRRIAFLGGEVLLPDPAERYLEENYGTAWRLPDPDHLPGFSAPNLLDPASPLVRSTIYLSLVNALLRGEPRAVRRYCAEAAARFPDDPLLAELAARAWERPE